MDADTETREQFNVRINSDLVKKTKVLALDLRKRHNLLIEEALRDILKKYRGKSL